MKIKLFAAFIALLAIAPMLGITAHAEPGAPTNQQVMTPEVQQAIDRMPQAQRENIMRDVEQLQKAQDKMAEELTELSQEQQQLMKAESFDQATYVKNVIRKSEIKSEFENRRAKVMASMFSSLNQKQRENLVEAWDRSHADWKDLGSAPRNANEAKS